MILRAHVEVLAPRFSSGELEHAGLRLLETQCGDELEMRLLYVAHDGSWSLSFLLVKAAVELLSFGFKLPGSLLKR